MSIGSSKYASRQRLKERYMRGLVVFIVIINS